MTMDKPMKKSATPNPTSLASGNKTRVTMRNRNNKRIGSFSEKAEPCEVDEPVAKVLKMMTEPLFVPPSVEAASRML